MKKCLIDNDSLRFGRSIYGLLLLAAFLFRNELLILIVAALMMAGIVSMKYNLSYQIHRHFLSRSPKDNLSLVEKGISELRFACTLGSVFLITAFTLLCLWKYITMAWALVLIISILMLFAGALGLCAASFIYIGFRIFLNTTTNQKNRNEQ